ncbi:hypothetical protein Baya_5335 [Bagarius yarrelli]|uniref:Uncharacterized protein n=1 Tax=Bagarius yarrelli TaxID=175774 RepID=A0A556TWI4_BAGYA|nr:hypothetical protein Baya_5335 [Bagarius yarrelli]
MGSHCIARIVIIAVSVLVFIIGITFNVLSARGFDPFLMSTGNISDKYNTQITPSGWTFSIWGVIYFWLTAMLIYIVSTIFRRNAFGPMYCSRPVLTYNFFICWILNILFNIIWLLLWDREVMIAALILLALVALTNYAMIFFSCLGLQKHGAWLNKYHKSDLWSVRILVQNGLAVYATWTSIATLINLTIVVSYSGGMSNSDAATLSLSLLSAEVLVWFVLENFFLDKHVRYILTVYPVVIVALSGNITKNFNASAPGINGIFTDSAPGTPLLSPLPKSPGSDEQNNGSQSPVPKSLLSFIGEIVPDKGLDVLESEAGIQVDHLNNKGSPLEEIAPIKTSSPIELLAIENVAENVEKPETSPLLFVIEDEDPVTGDLSKSQMNQISESPKDVPHRYSDSMPSPPAQFKIGKPTKLIDPKIRLTPRKAPEASDPIGKTSALEAEKELQMDGCTVGLSLSPVVLIQKHQPEPSSKEQPNKQVQEVAVEVGVKKSLFREKLKNSLQPKASGKQETLKQPARVPSPQVQDEDFMILEDDCPIRFTIPRKNITKEKLAAEGVSVESHSKEKASPKQTIEADNPNEGPKKKRKAKHGKDQDTTTKDAAVLSAPDERDDEVNVDMENREPVGLSSDINRDTDILDTVPLGKNIPKGKTSKSKQQLNKDGKDVSVKNTAKTRKTAKLATSTHTAPEVPVSGVKEKASQIKSAVPEGVSESIGVNPAKPKKQDKGRSAVKNNNRAEKQAQVPKVQNHTAPTSPPTEQPEVQSTSTGAQKKPPKIKKTKESLKIKELVSESDVSEDVSATSKRKRKPPGEWWLTQLGDDNTLEQPESVQSSQVPKSKKKTQKKSPMSADSREQESPSTSEKIPNVPVTVQKMSQKVKKFQAVKSRFSPAGSRKNPKSAGGKRKPKAGAQEQCDMTPALMVEEEARDHGATGQLSPITCEHRSRQASVTPAGVKRVFQKIYTQVSQSGSAQKGPPGALEHVPVKRQRKPPQNWWEVPQTQKTVESYLSPRTSSPQTSRPPMGPPQTAFHQKPSLKKTVARGQQKTKIINTPKSVKTSLATFDAIYDSGKLGPQTERAQGTRQKGRRNLLHSLEDQSEQSSENIHSDYQQQASSNATFDVCVSGVVSDSSAAWRKSNPRVSSGSNKATDYDIAFKSGPSSLIELERYEEHEDVELPSSRIIPPTQVAPRVLSECDLCGPPLKPIVLDTEDWDNLCVWFAHIWPNMSKKSKSISPDDFHWHCHAGRAMGHMVDLQNNTFSSGKILLGSYMRKPAQMDLNAVTSVFSLPVCLVPGEHVKPDNEHWRFVCCDVLWVASCQPRPLIKFETL